MQGRSGMCVAKVILLGILKPPERGDLPFVEAPFPSPKVLNRKAARSGWPDKGPQKYVLNRMYLH
jgi:hypothetical protein